MPSSCQLLADNFYLHRRAHLCVIVLRAGEAFRCFYQDLQSDLFESLSDLFRD